MFELSQKGVIESALSQTAVENIWGVGIRTAIKLKRAGIRTAVSLRDVDIRWVRQRFGINGVRTVYELRGVSCYELEDEPPSKKGIRVSRMFGRKVASIDELKEAVASYASRAGEKLRAEAMAAGSLTVFVMTSRFVNVRSRYFNSNTVSFPVATNYTPELIEAATRGAEKLYREGFLFNRAGVMLNELVPESRVQGNLFDTIDRQRLRRLMCAVDSVNMRVPGGPLRWAAEGMEQPWRTKFGRRSRRCTTRWDELVEVA